VYFFNSRNAPKFPYLSKIGTELLRNMMAAVTRTTNKEQKNNKISKTSTWHVHHAFFKEQTNKEFDVCKKFEKYVVANFLFL